MNSTSVLKYTFLLPAYKPDFFEEALVSIKSQTYSDFKVVVSDDCSPYSLKPIFDKVCGEDFRFTFRRNAENMGSKSLVSHWNLLVDTCETEYLIMASDDDVYDSFFLEEIDKLCVKYPDVDLIHARVREINEHGEIIRKDAIYGELVSQLEFISQYQYFNHIECVANNVFKVKSLRERGGFYDFPLAWSSDTATSFALAKHGVANTKDILFSFRMSGINLSSDKDEKPQITRQKFKAILLYKKCVDNILDRIFPNDSYEAHLKTSVMNYHKRHVISAASYYSYSLTFTQFIGFIKEFSRKKHFDNKYQIYQLVKKWWKNRR